MDKQGRREAVRDYKERKVAQGIFAVRCPASGETWVGASKNLDQQKNGVWFGLRTGGHPNRAMQAAWTAHGEAAFAFQVLEEIETRDLGAYALANLLKERHQRWLEDLGAGKVVG
ncbi:MAG: GIY-YIG nuclease family protein [Phenylobacterium sp.]